MASGEMAKKFLMVSLRSATVAFVCLISFSVNTAMAQTHPPINKYYADTVTLIASGSEDDFFGGPEFTIADITGDGLDEVIYTATASDAHTNVDAAAPLFIWTRGDDGLLFNAVSELMNGPRPVLRAGGADSVLVADFNGDGQQDMFLSANGGEPDCGPDSPFWGSCWPGAQNWLLLSDDQGKFNDVTATHLPQYSDFSHGSTVIDYDGDGDPDLWVTNLGENDRGADPGVWPDFGYLMENDGTGQFTVVADASRDGTFGDPDIPIIGRNGILPEGHIERGYRAHAIDVDGDGDMDLNRGVDDPFPPEQFELWGDAYLFNDGNGHFEWSKKNTWDLPEGWRSAANEQGAIYDFNRDGLDDQIQFFIVDDPVSPETTPVSPANTLQILISNGDETFRDETQARFGLEPSLGYRYLQLHDFEGDGQKDIFLDYFENAANQRTIILLNDGEGFFRRIDNIFGSVRGIWLDVDGDGGTDLLWQAGGSGYHLSKMIHSYGPEMVGTEEDERQIGGALDNVFRGMGGNDVLDGGLGDDDLDGGPGDDELNGGKGNDRIIPGSGTDSIDGGSNRDTVEYDFPITEAEILYDQITLISKNDDSSNDQIETTEYALFSDAATPLPTKPQSAIANLNGLAGLWYDPDLDGEGFNVITTPSGTVIFFYGSNANSERLWLISELLENGLAFEQVFDLQMYEAQGGTFAQPAPSSEALSEWGRLKGLFDACGSGRFALHGEDGVKTSYQTRLAGITNADCQVQTLSAPSGLAGLWYDPLLEGEGYNLIITENVTVMLFYGYATDGQRLWLLSEAMAGTPVIGETATLQMFVSTDGTFDEPLASSEVLEEWGELEIMFSSCGTAVANLAGDDGEKTSNLSKLAGIDQSTCP